MRLIVLTIFTVLALFPLQANADAPCTPAQLSAITITEATDAFDFNISYPVLCAPSANQVIRDYVSTLMGEMKAFPPDPELGSAVTTYQCEASYEVSGLENGKALSVALHIYAYTGGAHGNSWPQTWLFDMTTGRLLGFHDILKEETLHVLGRMVRGDIAKQLGESMVADMLDSGLKPELRNFSNFILNHEGIRFLFPPYQVAPYVAGQQETTVPWTKLAPYLSDEMLKLLH